ncbi:hypothetical protein [Burkholderia vietnamiensis]|uniref:hypothetical protein n=1 Tax=Burkholderia vietnamiensis TaxID=60552 RepID=UPI001593536C|nr:hypothetical protein [Burkholderia vietnamiensis]
MKQIRDTVWQRRGISWIWDAEAMNSIARPDEVLSLRQFMRAVGRWQDHWPDALPSNQGNAIVIAGLDGCLDLLSPNEADVWLGSEMKDAILSFQDYYGGDAALVFWLPSGQRRLHVQTASDAVTWRCSAPFSAQQLDFGRLLWGEAREYPQEIVLADGAFPAGLFHLRIT